jgi:hypothetical protein
MPCIFCQIIAGELPARTVYRDGRVIAIHDIAPQAPTHILILPVRHVASLAETQDGDGELYFPFPFAIHFQPTAIQDHVQRPARPFRQLDVDGSPPLRQGAVIGHRQGYVQQGEPLQTSYGEDLMMRIFRIVLRL